MPTPLAHGMAGIAVARTVRTGWRAWHFAILAFIVTLLPDFDFVPGVLLGEPGLFHRGFTHSILGAALISAPIAAILAGFAPLPVAAGSRRGGLAAFVRWYGFVLPVYSTHLALDLISPGTVHNSGLPLLWPMTDALFTAPVPLPQPLHGFFALEFGPDSAGFFATLFSWHGVAVYIAEAVLYSPIVIAPLLAARLAERRNRLRDARLSGAPGMRPAPGPTGAPRHSSRRAAPADAAG